MSDFNFTVNRGEIVGILGPNGCGKSTLLKTLANILKPIAGTAFIDGKKVFTMKPVEIAKKMSVMFTERGDVGFLTAFDVVALGRYPYSDAFGRLSVEDNKIIMDCLKIVNAEHLANRFFFEMSDGEKQKVLIARALAQEPEVVLMDEPTSFLDAKHKIEITLLLRKIASEKNVAIILTTHDIELALRICDRVMLIKDGKIVCDGFPEEILTSEVFNEVYNVNSACFETHIGSFEVRGSGNPKVHVVCGSGTGAKLMRFLTKKNIGFTVGVIHENDIDFVIAKSIANDVVSERAYQKIQKSSLKKAIELAEDKIVIDSGFPVGEINEENFELFKVGKKVVSLRKSDKFKLNTNVVKVNSLKELLMEVNS